MRAPLLLSFRPHVLMTVPIAPERAAGDDRASAVIWFGPTPTQPVYDSAALLKALDRPPEGPESREKGGRRSTPLSCAWRCGASRAGGGRAAGRASGRRPTAP